MPTQITDIKKFTDLINKPELKSIRIKKGKKETKFKAKTAQRLYTLVVADKEKASKLEFSLKNFNPKVIN